MTAPARVVATIRPDTVFIPYHWPGRKAANQLTNRALDPISKIPEYKVAAVRVERIDGVAHVTIDRYIVWDIAQNQPGHLAAHEHIKGLAGGCFDPFAADVEAVRVGYI